jgi:hypothetical protein
MKFSLEKTMENTQAHIDWNYSGKPNLMFGTGATALEQTLVWFFGLTGTLILGWMAWTRQLPWTWWQYILAGLMALDVLGGVVANSLNTCKRFYHTPRRPDEMGSTAFAKNHIAFTVLHVYPLIAGLFFGKIDLVYGLVWYAVLLLSSIVVLQTPLYLRRPLSLGIIMTVILINLYLIRPVPGFEWLIPALFLKIVYGHVVREEPYRP